MFRAINDCSLSRAPFDYSSGEPGNPQKPAREIVVDMTEIDYSRAVIQVKRVSRFASLSAIAARKSADRGTSAARRR